jgi:Ca2+-binding RTX toxin-like protein
MFTYKFGVPTNMLSFDVSQYTNGSVNFSTFSSTSIEIDDSNGDKAIITGKNFSINFVTGQPSGTVTGAVLTNAAHQTVLTATNLNLDLGKLYNDRKSKPALYADLFSPGGGVSITGSTGTDILLGGTGNDIIRSGGGKDILIGGLGADNLSGGTLNSQFRYNTINDTVYAHPDVITDFHTGDKIDLSRVDSNNMLAGTQHTWHLGKTLTHTGDVVVTYNAITKITTIALYNDTDGTADGRILLKGNHANLTTTDFIGVGPPPPAAAATQHQFVAAMAGFGATHAAQLSALAEAHLAMGPSLTAPRFAHA